MALRVCLHQSHRRFQAVRRIFLVQSLRNQWFSRFACTKAAAVFRLRGAFSWCKAYAINGFPSLLAPKPPPFRAPRRIFLVQGLRNQWLCRFACTKAAAVFERRGAFSWCKAYAINGFASLLAPKPPPISGAGGFGRWGTGYGGGPPARRYFFLGLPFALVRFRNSCLRFPASSLRFRFAVFGFITEKPKKPRGSFFRA